MNVIAEVPVAPAHNFSPELVTQTSALNKDKITNNNTIIHDDDDDHYNNNNDNDNDNNNITTLRSSSSPSSYSFSPPPPSTTTTLLNYYSSSHNSSNLIDCNIFSEFIENNNYNNELFTISIDELAKAASITKKSSSSIIPIQEINRKSCFTASSIGCASSPSALLPDNVLVNKKSNNYHNNKIFRSYKGGSKSLKNNSIINFSKFKKSKFNTIMNNNNNNVSQKATTKTTRTSPPSSLPPPPPQPKSKFTQANINQKIKILLGYYPPRFLILFLLGSLTSFVVDHLLTQNNITEYPKDITKLIDTAAWIPPTCGFSAALVGSLFPLADYLFMCKPKEFQREWSSVMRCIGGFMGVAYAATKLHWSSNYQVSCTLALISMVLWFLFDRTRHGFVMSTLFSSIGTIVMYLLVSNGIYSFTHADFFGVRSWIPCILYSSCVCFGAIGRQLMIVPEEWFEDDTNVTNNTFNNDVNNNVIGNNISNNNNNNNNKTKSRSKKH